MRGRNIVAKCKECGHICDSLHVCYRCRKGNLELLVDLEKFEKLQTIIQLVYGNEDNLIADFAKDSICEINCPIARTCPQFAAESADAVEYCRIQLQNWYTK